MRVPSASRSACRRRWRAILRRKGSVALDGVSLTVNEVDGGELRGKHHSAYAGGDHARQPDRRQPREPGGRPGGALSGAAARASAGVTPAAGRSAWPEYRATRRTLREARTAFVFEGVMRWEHLALGWRVAGGLGAALLGALAMAAGPAAPVGAAGAGARGGAAGRSRVRSRRPARQGGDRELLGHLVLAVPRGDAGTGFLL